MPRYIDVEAFIKDQCNSCDGYCEKVDCDCLSCDKPYQCDVIQELKAFPTVSADDVRGVGEWIVKQTAIGKDYTICSACKTDFKFKTDKGTLARLDMRGMPFCPSCGARMKGAEDEQD